MMYNYPFFSFPSSSGYPPNSYKNYNRNVQSQNLNSAAYSDSLKANTFNIKNMQRQGLNNKLDAKNGYNSLYSYNHNIIESSRNNFAPENKSNYNFNNSNESRNIKKDTFSGFGFLNNFLHQEDRNEDEGYFEIFGLKLYNDDLLLLGLIFFLYKEDVKDQFLLFSLILLLLS